MKLKNLAQVALVLYLTEYSFAQQFYINITNQDTAYTGLDVLFENGYHILGNAWNFAPPYNGIPIEGEYSFGNVQLIVDKNGQLECTKYLDNNEVTPSLTGFGRVPGSFLISTKDNKMLLPFTKHYGIVPCQNPVIGKLTDRVGLIDFGTESHSCEATTTIFDEFGLCGAQTILGYAVSGDSFLLVTKNSYEPEELTFEWFSSENNTILDKSINHYGSFEALGISSEQDIDGLCFFLGRDWADGFNMSLLKTNTLGDSLERINIYADTNTFTPILLVENPISNSIVVFASKYNSDFSEELYYLLCYDTQLNEKWRKQFPYPIQSIASLKNLDGYLVAYPGQDAWPHINFNVGVINGVGDLVESFSYGEEYDLPVRLRIIDESRFAVIGNKFIGYENSSEGNPFSSIFLLADSIPNVLPAAIGESMAQMSPKIKIAPNPSNDYVHVMVDKKMLDDACLRLYDFHGNICIQEKLSNRMEVKLNTSAMATGIYLLNLLEDGEIVGSAKIFIYR